MQGSKIAAVVASLCLTSLAWCVQFTHTNRVMPVMLSQLDQAETRLREGSFDWALAYTDSVAMDKEIKIFAQKTGVNGRTAATCDRALKGAIKMWEDALPGGVHFTIVDSMQGADVSITFKPDVSRAGMMIAGNIEWDRTVARSADGDVRNMTKADIDVRTRKPGGGDMGYELVRHTCAHELGHLLGLTDTAKYGDLMGPMDLNRPVSAPSHDELAALLELRECSNQLRSEVMFQTALKIHLP